MTSITQIQSDFNKVISYSQGITDPQTDELFERWKTAKQSIIDSWGGKLIISTGPVIFDLSPEEKRKRLNEFIDVIYNTYENESLAEFLDIISTDFFANRLSQDYYVDNMKIVKGTKVVKAFKYFESDERVLTDLQNQASMIIQEDKICGTLCLSVHPLDYLSSSENTYHWRSCHALDGDYRAGNLSYMVDSSTIVCYLKKDMELQKLPNFPEDVLWNSKKWRMLLFLEDQGEALFAGRQYPFFSPTALKLVRTAYLAYTTQADYHWSDWYDDTITTFPRPEGTPYRDANVDNGRNVMLNGRIYGMLDLVTDAKNSMHYNDLLYSSFYIPYYCWCRYPKAPKRPLHFSIGGSVPCLCCGNYYSSDMGSGTMICVDCDYKHGTSDNEYCTYCACCESRIIRAEGRWVHGIGELVCQHCFETQTQVCDRCEESWYTCDIKYSHKHKQYLCPNCREHYPERHYFTPFFDY